MTYLLPHVGTWEDWAAIFNDVTVWRPVVAEICFREGLPFRRLEASNPGTHAVFILDRRRVIKVYAPFWRDFAVERELYTMLGRQGTLPVPKVLSSGLYWDRIEWPYLIMELIDGQPIRDVRDEIGEGNLLEVAAELGKIVRALHQTDAALLRGLERREESWSHLLERRKAESVDEIERKKLLPPGVVEDLKEFLKTATAGLEEYQPVLVHGDITDDNLLVREVDGRWGIAGLLDFDDARIGAKGYEWPALWFGALAQDVSAMRRFLDSYQPGVALDERFSQQALAWTLLHDFGTGMVEKAFEAAGPTAVIGSLQELREFLWPSSIVEQSNTRPAG